MSEQRHAPMPAEGDTVHWEDGRTATVTASLGGTPVSNIWMVDTDRGRVIVNWSWTSSRYIVDDR